MTSVFCVFAFLLMHSAQKHWIENIFWYCWMSQVILSLKSSSPPPPIPLPLYVRLPKFEISPGQITPGKTLTVLAYMGEGD